MSINGGQRDQPGFSLDMDRKILWRDGEVVPLPPKAAEILCVLARHRGEVVTKTELLDAVWGDSFVEESVISNNIYLLRKTLTELTGVKGLIQTVPRRGYRFGETGSDGTGLVLAHHVFEQTIIRDAAAEPYVSEIGDRSPRGHRTFASPLRLTMASLAAVLAALAIIGWQYRKPSAPTNIRSMAVLQLKPLGTDAGDSDKALGLGLSEALATRVGASRNLVVRPLGSVDQTDPLEAGRKMQVDAVLAGTFQRDSDRIRITMRLLRVSDGSQIWSGTFNESQRDIFKLQDALSEQAANALAVTLNQQQRQMILKRYTANVEAYEAYLRGRYLYSQGEAKDGAYDRAIVEFKHSLELDPNYALAYTGLADAYARKGNNSRGKERRDLYEEAKANAIKALALDEDLAEAHVAKGWIDRIYDWNWAESEKHFLRAVELAPNEARNYHLYAFLLITLGRTAEGVENAHRAMELDPIGKASVYAYALYCDRQFDRSIAEFNKILGISPDVTVWRGLASAYVSAGRPEDAIRLYEQAPPERRDDFTLKIYMPMAYRAAGRMPDAANLLAELEETSLPIPERSTNMAALYSELGRREEALRLLRQAIEVRDDRLMWIKTNPHFDNLRSEPEFQEILRKMNLASS